MLKRTLFVIATLFLFFFLLDKIPLWSSDEGRYGEIAREMLESKNFVVPHFNYLPYLDKPVLAPVLTAGAYALFGVNALATRLVSVISALLGIFFLHRFTRRLFDLRTADFSALILLTTLGYVLVGRFAVIDMLMTFLLSMTLFCFMTAFFEQRKGYYLAGYTLMGLAFLTKGLIAIVLPFLIFFIFLLWTKNLGELKRMRLPAGFVIIAAIILPWMLSISHKEPEFFNEFILKQHFSRFATGSFGRKRPFWFFVPILLATAFPWTFFLPAAMVQGMKEKLLQRRKLQFLLCWIAGIVVFFSIPKSKLPYYILPVSMPLAIFLGDFFSKATSGQTWPSGVRKLLTGAWKALAALSVFAAAGVHLYLIFGEKKTVVDVLAPVLKVGTLIVVLGCVTSYLFYRKGKIGHGVFVLSGMIYGALLVTVAAMKIISPIQSSQAYAALLKTELRPGDITAAYSSPDHFSDFPFYLGRRIMIVGSDRGTLQGQSEELSAEETKNSFLSAGDFVNLLSAPPRGRVFCLVPQEKFHELREAGLQNYKVMKEDRENLLIRTP